MSAVKVIKVMGTSQESWENAAEEAFVQARSSVDDISGIKVTDWTAHVQDNNLTEYKATVEVAFPVKEEIP